MANAKVLIRRLDSNAANFSVALRELLAHEQDEDATIEASVTKIISAVRQRGDAALLKYTRRFDQLSVGQACELELSASELQFALASLRHEERQALEIAAARIRDFHQRQMNKSWTCSDEASGMAGSRFGQIIKPLDRAGLYVPGGKAAYPSSVLMNAIPAKVAGVEELVMVSPTPQGEKNLLVLAAAALAGVDRVFTVGGAQAIAALAYGTPTVPQVDKVVGPGNAYVAAAKRKVFGAVGIDMIAGPSEIMIISDGSANPDWLAMDLFSQAEHDEMAQSILVSPQAEHLEAVAASIGKLLPTMPRRRIIEKSLVSRGALIKVGNLAEACELANRIAPEHLQLALADPHSYLPSIRHAGAIFCGVYTSEALGDYCAGPNHVLPTAGSARFSSPLGVYDFQKRTSLIEVTQQGAQVLGNVAQTLAESEGLFAHAQSARYRTQ